MRILGLSGALRRASTNTGLVRALADLAPAGVTIEMATLHGIPLFDQDDEAVTGKPPEVQALEARIRAADALIIASPEYNYSIPGVLKNATDWLSRGGSPFRGKPTGILGASSGGLGTARGQYHLRQNLQALEAITMPKPELFVSTSGQKFDADGNLTDEDTRHKLGAWLTALIAWSEKVGG
jgi:chromate reductase